MKGEVRQQFKSPLEVRAEQGRVEADFFLGGVGVQFAAHILNRLLDKGES